MPRPIFLKRLLSYAAAVREGKSYEKALREREAESPNLSPPPLDVMESYLRRFHTMKTHPITKENEAGLHHS